MISRNASMKTYIAIFMLFTCCCSRCETILLFRTDDNKPQYLLVRDYQGKTNEDDRQVFIADMINFQSTNWGTELTLSNVVVYTTILSKKKDTNPGSSVRQSSARFEQLKVGFLSGTQLIFRNRVIALDTVKNEDLHFKN